jgi:23S rRNA-intervening sequence protein
MIAHIGIYVESLKDSSEFYTSLLEAIGWSVLFKNDCCVAFGKGDIPFFEIYTGKAASSPIHIAFECTSQEEVKTFYNTAIQLNARDNGEPGYRDYFPHYYASYVIDLNGHNLEGLHFGRRAYLTAQLQRAGTSIALNSAEGAGEFSPHEKSRFYRMAKRSGTETAAILDVAK